MSELIRLNLANNRLDGRIENLESLSNLIELDVSSNNLQGSIPKFLFPEAEVLSLNNNRLEGSIPDLTTPRLLYLRLGNNSLSGTIPRLLMSLLVEMDLKKNNISGSIPTFTMPLMKSLDLSNNNLSGTTPDFTMPQLEYLSLKGNNLTGTIPNFNMPKLESISLSYNQLTGTIPSFNSRQLLELYLNENKLQGNIPVFPSTLKNFDIENNPGLIYPRNVLEEMYIKMNGESWMNKTGWLSEANVCTWHGVTCNAKCPSIQSEQSMCPIKSMNLARNKISGYLTSGTWLSGLRDLEELTLDNNELQGTLPNLMFPELIVLNLDRNQLEGDLPNFEMHKLVSLSLAHNKFTDFSQRLHLPSLTKFDLSSNQLKGTLPSFINLTSLVRLDVSSNKLVAISQLSLPNLQTLILSNNEISGSLPDLNLAQLSYLDLSNNNLDEPLPDWQRLVNLEHLIVSFNQKLTGALPKGMDQYRKISTVDIKETRMRRNSNQLFPKTLNPYDQFQMFKPSDNFQCPALFNLNISRSNVDIPPEYYDFYNCRCLKGTFGVRNDCLRCPSGCKCETGLELKGCFPSPNLEDMKNIVPCPNPSACETSISSGFITEVSSDEEQVESCLEGYEGRVCSRCKAGFGAHGRSCVKCDSTLVYASLVVGPLLIICLVIYLFRSSSDNSGKLGILILHTQTLSVVATVMSNTPTIEKWINLPFSVSSINIPSISCVFGTTDAITPIAASFIRLPILVIAGFFAFQMTTRHNQDKVLFVLLNLARFIYYPIVLETLGVFSCTLYDKGYDAWFLNAWPWITCNPATEEYEKMLGLAVPTFLIFGCGFPVLLWYIIRDNAHVCNQKRSDEERRSRRTRYGFLYLPFEKDYQLWGVITTARLFCFGLVVRIVAHTSLAVIFILLLILMQGSIRLQYSNNPFISKEENAMELISLYTIYISYFLVLISGLVRNSSWIIGFTIALNTIILALILWKTFARYPMILFCQKIKVADMVSSASLPSVAQVRASASISVEMKR